MSCGLGSPSAMTSPFSTCSPSKTLRWRHFGISSSYLSVPSLVMIKRRLPLVSLPKLTVPERSARIAESFGLRASNKSQTAGDVASLRGLLRDTCNDIAHRHLGAVFEADDGARRQRVHRRNIRICE